MSTEIKYEVTLPESGTTTNVLTQHGMAQPDGTIVWGDVREMTPSGRQAYVAFHDLGPSAPARRRQDAEEAWDRIIRARAAAAHMDPEALAEQYRLVKRTVVVAVTDVEDAK